jgi:hypothetical protein
MFLPLILPTRIKTFHKLYPGRRSNWIWIRRANPRREGKVSDLIDDFKSYAQFGAAHFGVHIWSIIATIGFQVHVKLMNKPRIDIHCIKYAQPLILLKNLINKLEWRNPDVGPQNPTFNHNRTMTNAFHININSNLRSLTTRHDLNHTKNIPQTSNTIMKSRVNHIKRQWSKNKPKTMPKIVWNLT